MIWAHRGMQGMRRREQPGCPGPMNLTSWTMTFCVLPTAEGFWRAKSSSLLCGDNSSSGVIKTGPDHKSEWIKPLGKERDKRYEKLYISKDAGQKSPEGMGVLGDIYFCLPRCHCCRGGLLTSVSMLIPTPGESNGSWLDGISLQRKEYHENFIVTLWDIISDQKKSWGSDFLLVFATIIINCFHLCLEECETLRSLDHKVNCALSLPK